jgi:hypothetical protein
VISPLPPLSVSRITLTLETSMPDVFAPTSEDPGTKPDRVPIIHVAPPDLSMPVITSPFQPQPPSDTSFWNPPEQSSSNTSVWNPPEQTSSNSSFWNSPEQATSFWNPPEQSSSNPISTKPFQLQLEYIAQLPRSGTSQEFQSYPHFPPTRPGGQSRLSQPQPVDPYSKPVFRIQQLSTSSSTPPGGQFRYSHPLPIDPCSKPAFRIERMSPSQPT